MSKLAALRTGTTQKKSKSSKKEVREVKIPDALAPAVRQVCELGYLVGEIKGPQDQKLKGVKSSFFEIWTAEMWNEKKRPENFAVVLPKLGDKGETLPVNDVRCVFQCKFRTEGIKTKAPRSQADIPEGCDTVQEAIVKILVSPVVGLSEANAKTFVDKEIDVRDEVELAPVLGGKFGQFLDMEIDELPDEMDEEEKVAANIAHKLWDYSQASTRAKTGRVNLPQWSDEERKNFIVTVQSSYLKDGMFDRVWEYCETVEQLRKLLLWCGVTRQVADFDFAMSDEPAIRTQRLQEVVGTYLIADDE